MSTFATSFLGCKVSFADQQSIRERLLADGHREVEQGERGDLAVVNTCCVTHEAVSKSRQALSRAARQHRAVYATGCAASLPGALDGLPGGVVVVGGSAERAAERIGASVGRTGCVADERGADRVRAFVKIQDGCSFSCAFCVIPIVRGATRSRSAEAVLTEARRRVARGQREIVLTGVNLGCFRDRAAGWALPRLVREVGELPGVERIRLSSIEINHLSAELVTALRETPTAARHLHVPLQSGDDAVLRAMGRRYDVRGYLAKLEQLDDFNLTSDVIVGFPTEDEPAFERTLEVVARAGLSKVHVFPYSPRPGTRTDAEDPVPPRVKRDRSARLRTASDEACRARWARRVGTTDRVLVDRPGLGYAEDYTPWRLDAQVGAFVRARAIGVCEDGVVAVAA